MSRLNLTINGQQISAQQGDTILQAAAANGIEIPNLCNDPRLVPTGSCRLCLVEVSGQRAPVTACTFEIAEGMIVETESVALRDLRKTVLELLFYEHRGICTTCDENGRCKLQLYGYEYQLDDKFFTNRASGQKKPNYTDGNAAIEYDLDKCIKCGRCIRICEEVQMDSALTFKERAGDVEVTTAFDMPLNDSTCELCGQCISTCPTGALYERYAKGKGQCFTLDKTTTTCVYCGVGCQIDLNIHSQRKEFVRATSEVGCVPNDGNLCVKGRFGFDFVQSKERLTNPLIKRNGKFKEATWDEALDLVANKLSQIKAEHGPDSIAGLSSAKCTNEENYIFQKFIRAAVGTNNVDHCARLCHASTVAGLARAFGSGAMTNSIEEFTRAECIFIIGSNTTEAHPVIGLNIKNAVVNKNAKLLVADPRTIDMKTRNRRRTNKRNDQRNNNRRPRRQSIHRKSHRKLSGDGRRGERLHTRMGRKNHNSPRRPDQRNSPHLRRRIRRKHHLQHGDHPALNRNRQRTLTGKPCDANRQRRQRMHRSKPAPRPEQRTGRMRPRSTPQCLPRIPVGRR